MSPAALSVYVFGIYLFVTGLGFTLIPNTLLPLFKFPKTNEPWIRVIGLLVILLGWYYTTSARSDLDPFFWATVVGRFGIFIGFILLVVFKRAKPMLILFGLIDAAAALWTYLTL